MDSILLLAARAVNRLGQPGTEVKAALRKLMEAVADMDQQRQGKPEPAAAAAAAVNDKTCPYGCQERHKLQECPRFLQLSPNFRYLRCMGWNLCLSCLEERHGEDATAIGARRGEQHACRQGGSMCNKCDEWHHPLPKCPKYRPVKYEDAEEEDQKAMAAAANAASGLRWKPIQMLAQTVKLHGLGKELNAFWDSGSQLTMITHKKAAECGLEKRKAPLLEVRAYNGSLMLVDSGYHVPLEKVDGGSHSIFAYGVELIATDMASSITDKSAVDHFPGITWEEVKGLTRAVDMLIGFDNHNVFPMEKARKEI